MRRGVPSSPIRLWGTQQANCACNLVSWVLAGTVDYHFNLSRHFADPHMLVDAYGSWSVSLAIPPPQQHFGLAVVAGACQLKLALAAFNLLLPAYPLDEGRIFADLLLLAGLHTKLAARTTASVATVLGLGVLGVGVWRTQVLTIAIGAWMLCTTAQLWKTIQAGTVDQHPMFSFLAAQQAGEAGTALPAAGTGYSRYVGSGAV
ncbi:hypothetical protein D9Q98_010066 [Chlorella vulgaris]|uniref:Uncharacterized protein n=1 Tax=Chlorella vulgaris TaxID=3077 RepID=A0A9D4TMQ3_CHLVU|nr:hypothetical protein D9Q98_010066 [Chlorella vulgaris]